MDNISLVVGAGAPLTNAAHPASASDENLVVAVIDLPLLSDSDVVVNTTLLAYVVICTVADFIPYDALKNP
jgi:hypothetical protein